MTDAYNLLFNYNKKPKKHTVRSIQRNLMDFNTVINNNGDDPSNKNVVAIKNNGQARDKSHISCY